MPYTAVETNFLLQVNEQHGTQTFQGAFQFLTGKIASNFVNNVNLFTGAILAYEFRLKDQTKILDRRQKEKLVLSKLKNDFQKYISESDSIVVEHLDQISKKYKEYSEAIDQLKTEKDTLFTEWFNKSRGDFTEFDEALKARIEELENTYREKLKLEEPAKYWSSRGDDLRKQGWWAFVGLLILVGGASFSLGELLWKTPEQIYASFFDGDRSAAIRWSIIYVTLISFIAFAVRAVTKVMFSSFHLARDSEERHTLTYFYLSLLKDDKVDEKDRELIIQSLFSRADTGLLKDDSSPTMPNDIVNKLFTKK